jgi:hypothetical protein
MPAAVIRIVHSSNKDSKIQLDLSGVLGDLQWEEIMMINKADGMMPSTFDFEYVAREVAFLVVYKRLQGRFRFGLVIIARRYSQPFDCYG